MASERDRYASFGRLVFERVTADVPDLMRLATDAELEQLAEDIAESWRRPDGADAREDILEQRRQSEAGKAVDLCLLGATHKICAAIGYAQRGDIDASDTDRILAALRQVVQAAVIEARRG